MAEAAAKETAQAQQRAEATGEGAGAGEKYRFRPPEPFLQRDLEAWETRLRTEVQAVAKKLGLDAGKLPEGMYYRAAVTTAAVLGWVPGVRDAEGVLGMRPGAVACLAMQIFGFVRAAREPDPEACGGLPVLPTATASPHGS